MKICFSRDSFNSLQNWLSDARSLASPHISIILVGNKKDLEHQREVSYQEACDYAKENGLTYIEGSALSGENVAESFLKCARQIINSIETGDINPDRIGSGIQFGDLSLRQMQRNSEKDTKNSSTCATRYCSI